MGKVDKLLKVFDERKDSEAALMAQDNQAAKQQGFPAFQDVQETLMAAFYTHPFFPLTRVGEKYDMHGLEMLLDSDILESQSPDMFELKNSVDNYLYLRGGLSPAFYDELNLHCRKEEQFPADRMKSIYQEFLGWLVGEFEQHRIAASEGDPIARIKTYLDSALQADKSMRDRWARLASVQDELREVLSDVLPGVDGVFVSRHGNTLLPRNDAAAASMIKFLMNEGFEIREGYNRTRMDEADFGRDHPYYHFFMASKGSPLSNDHISYEIGLPYLWKTDADTFLKAVFMFSGLSADYFMLRKDAMEKDRTISSNIPKDSPSWDLVEYTMGVRAVEELIRPERRFSKLYSAALEKSREHLASLLGMFPYIDQNVYMPAMRSGNLIKMVDSCKAYLL